MARRKPETNVDFVKSIMETSRYGPLAQLFVLDALDKWSAVISKQDPSAVDTPLIAGAAWVGVANEIKEKLAQRMNKDA